jgi:hypothetical protein
MPDGTIVAATSHEDNAPDKAHPSVWISADNGNSFTPAGLIPGLGTLCVAFDDTYLYTANQESPEHDDPDTAGQAHLFRSSDGGANWEEGGELTGANRVYNLTFTGNRLYALTGIRGKLLYSEDQGDTWTACGALPDGIWIDPIDGVEYAEDVTRAYNVLKLADGRLLVGTGAMTGDVFVSNDECASWTDAGDTGPNIVAWGLGQTSDGTVWLGTGSKGGDVYTSAP